MTISVNRRILKMSLVFLCILSKSTIFPRCLASRPYFHKTLFFRIILLIGTHIINPKGFPVKIISFLIHYLQPAHLPLKAVHGCSYSYIGQMRPASSGTVLHFTYSPSHTPRAFTIPSRPAAAFRKAHIKKAPAL